jgi:murein DD-endopeptidase MepM/ murein hydrolase activator NlpD
MHGLKIPHKSASVFKQNHSMKGLLGFPLLLSLFGLGVIANPPAGDGTIIRGYEPPKSSYSSGHRGIDLAAQLDEFVYSPLSGRVHFAGYVVDRPVVTIATATILMSFEPVQSLVGIGTSVKRGEIIGWIARGGHCDQRCLHVGVRRITPRAYLDPFPYLLGLPRLLPTKP